MDFDDPKQAVCCCCSLTAIVAIGVFLFFSFASLDAYEYGLDYSSITKTIDDQLYTPGFHFLGFGHKFIKYPSVVQSMEFSTAAGANGPPISSRTDDGLMINFKASFQYILMPNRIYDLFMRYGEDYRTPCEKYAIDTLNDAATNYDAFSYFQESDIIRIDMQQYLNTTLALHCYSNLQFFQLTQIDLPNDFEDAIDDTQTAIQEIKTAETELVNVQIELNTTIAKAAINSEVIINNAQASASAKIQNNEAQVMSFYNVITSQAEAYSILQDQLNMDSLQLIQYIKSQTIKEHNQTDVVFGFDSSY